MLSLFVFIIYFYNVTSINAFQPRTAAVGVEEEPTPEYTDERDKWVEPIAPIVEEPVVVQEPITFEIAKPEKAEKKKPEPELIIEETKEEAEVLAEQLVAEKGFYDPTLDLGSYKFPPLELLNEYDTGKVQVTQEELNLNQRQDHCYAWSISRSVFRASRLRSVLQLLCTRSFPMRYQDIAH